MKRGIKGQSENITVNIRENGYFDSNQFFKKINRVRVTFETEIYAPFNT